MTNFKIASLLWILFGLNQLFLEVCIWHIYVFTTLLNNRWNYLLYFIQCSCKLVVKSIYCDSLGEKFINFPVCHNYNGLLSINITVLQPVRNCLVQIEFISTTMKSVKLNTTWDACAFMKNRKRFRSLEVFYKIISENSNINHSCPYTVSNI